jgi:leucyl aminopeptidase
MKYTCKVSSLQDLEVDTAVLFVESFAKLEDTSLKQIDGSTGNALTTLLNTGEFSGQDGETVVLYQPSGFASRRLVLTGIGTRTKVDHDSYRRAMGRASRLKAVLKSGKLGIYFGRMSNSSYFQAAIEGYVLGSYKLKRFKTGQESEPASRVDEVICGVGTRAQLRKLERAVSRAAIIADGQSLVRQLAETPSNELTPAIYARKAQELARQYHVRCRVLDEKAIAQEKMGALLAVAKGSQELPRFIILEYKGGPSGQQPIVLIGKGVTFDSGGISIKQAANMHEMKQDMAGSAVVLVTLLTASRLGIKRNLVGLIPTAENMPSGSATRPGDIVVSRKGKTIEIINTDAEGRLLLADALDYANKFKPQAVIDIATLTGGCLYVLGYAGSPIIGNNNRLLDQLRAASKATAERVWELPIWDDHRDQMKSSIADLVNSGGKPASTIAAAAFLENFIGDWPWAHIDIAYTDSEPKGKPYTPKGPTGFGLRLLVETVSNWKKV